MAREFTPPETCPVCGETVPRDAKSCPGCGADERAGWDEDAAFYDGIDLLEESFVDEDQPAHRPRKSTTPKFWLVVAAVLLVLTILSSLIH